MSRSDFIHVGRGSQLVIVSIMISGQWAKCLCGFPRLRHFGDVVGVVIELAWEEEGQPHSSMFRGNAALTSTAAERVSQSHSGDESLFERDHCDCVLRELRMACAFGACWDRIQISSKTLTRIAS